MSCSFRQELWLLLVCLSLSFPVIGSEMDDVVPGNWMELRGNKNEQGVFVAKRADLIEPQSEDVLIGTISSFDESSEFTLLGQLVQISPKTSFSKVARNDLLNKRVKVEGYYRGRKRFSARKVSARGPAGTV